MNTFLVLFLHKLYSIKHSNELNQNYNITFIADNLYKGFFDGHWHSHSTNYVDASKEMGSMKKPRISYFV